MRQPNHPYTPEELAQEKKSATDTIGILIAANHLYGRKRVVDYGCGTGRSTSILQKHIGAGVVGTDRRLDMLAFASEHNKENSQLAFTPLGALTPNEFNGALATFVHVEAQTVEELRSIDLAVARLLGRDGMYAILTGNPAAVGNAYRSFSTEKIRGAVDHTLVRSRLVGGLETIDHFWTQAAHERSLHDAGFRVEDVAHPTIPGEKSGLPPPYLLITAVKR